MLWSQKRNIKIFYNDSVTEGCLSLTYSLKEIQEIYVTYLQTWLNILGSCAIANTYPDIGTVYLVCPPGRFIQKDKTVDSYVPSSIPPIPISKCP